MTIKRCIAAAWGGVRRPRTGRLALAAALALTSLITPLAPPPAQAAQTWRVTVGAESRDEGIQALGMYPGRLSINAGDSVTFAFATAEHHTVTFGTTPPRPPRPAGWTLNWPGPPFLWTTETTSTAVADNTTFVNSGIRDHASAPYTLSFPTVGTFNYRCLLHGRQTGVVEVRAAGTPYQYDQAYYDRQTIPERNKLIAEGRQLRAQQLSAALAGPGHNRVAAGAGNGLVAVDRFLPGEIKIRVGETVTWTNPDPVTPHVITFGPVPYDTQFGQSELRKLAWLRPLGTVGAAGQAQSATLPTNPPGGTVNSAIIGGFSPPGAPLPPTQFSVTFTAPGTYRYTCPLHHFGMDGVVVVQ